MPWPAETGQGEVAAGKAAWGDFANSSITDAEICATAIYPFLARGLPPHPSQSSGRIRAKRFLRQRPARPFCLPPPAPLPPFFPPPPLRGGWSGEGNTRRPPPPPPPSPPPPRVRPGGGGRGGEDK